MRVKVSRLKRVIISLLCMLCIFIPNMTFVSYAATTYGYGFSSKPITIYAANNLSSMETSQLKESIAVWNSTRVGTVLVYGGQKSLLSMYWMPDGSNGVVKGSLGNGVTAITSTKNNGSNITEADISLNTNVTYNNGSTIIGDYYLKSVLIHELGHVLGLADNWSNSSVMYSSYTGRTGLSASDISDLDLLY